MVVCIFFPLFLFSSFQGWQAAKPAKFYVTGNLHTVNLGYYRSDFVWCQVSIQGAASSAPTPKVSKAISIMRDYTYANPLC
jgi:hypothetical protein